LDFCGLDYVKIEFSLGIYSGADHRSTLIQAVFKDCPQVIRYGQLIERNRFHCGPTSFSF